MDHKAESFSSLQQASLLRSFKNGIELYCRAQYKRAAEWLEEVAPAYPQAYLFLDLIEKKSRGSVNQGYLINEQKRKEIQASLASFAQKPQGPRISKYEYGLYCFAKERYEEAVSWFKVAGRMGEPSAQYYLGLCYAQGKGISKDLMQAAECFFDATMQGHEEALFYLARCCMEDRRISQKYSPLFHQTVAEGKANQDTQFYAGFCYFTGTGFDRKGEKIKKDYEEAAKLFLPIAKLGNVMAQYLFAMCFYSDTNLVMAPAFKEMFGFSHFNTCKEKAYFLAEQYVRYAAVNGNIDAQYTLAIFLLKGVGGKQDFKEACDWFSKAAAQKHEKAQHALKRLHAEIEARLVLPAESDSPEDDKINSIIGKFDEQNKNLPEMLATQGGYMKNALDDVFAFESTNKSVSLPAPVKELKSVQPLQSQSTGSENTSSSISLASVPAMKPETNSEVVNQEAQVIHEPAPVKQDEALILKPNSEKKETESLENLVLVPEVKAEMVSQETQVTHESASVVPPESEGQLKKKDKKKKEKKSSKQEAPKPEDIAPPNDHKLEPIAVLSIFEAQNLLNQAIEKPLDAQSRGQLKRWFEAVKDEQVENVHYWLGIYYEYVAKKQDKASEYYGKVLATDSTYAEAQYHLGKYHENTKPKNRPEALRCYGKSKENGYQLAKDAHERLTKEQEKVREQKEKEAQKLEQEKIRKQKEKEARALLAKKAKEPVSLVQEAKPVVVSEPTEQTVAEVLSPKPLKPDVQSSPKNMSELEAKQNLGEIISEAKKLKEKEAALVQENEELKKQKASMRIELGKVMRAVEGRLKTVSGDSKNNSEATRAKGKEVFEKALKAHYLGEHFLANEGFMEADKCGYSLGCLYRGWLANKRREKTKDKKNTPQVETAFATLQKEKDSFLKNLDTPQKLFRAGVYCELAAGASGNKKFKKQAFEYYEQSAKGGYAEALVYLGRYYFMKQPPDHKEALKWFKQAEIQEEPEAYFYLGMVYSQGLGGEAKDASKAFDTFQKGAEKGHVYAQYQLGVCYVTGESTVQDLKKAFENFKAASRECLEAACYVAMHYWNGWGVGKNCGLAKKILTELIKKGSEEAQTLLNTFELEEKVRKGLQEYDLEHYSQALNIFQELAEKEDYPLALLFLGIMHEKGYGVSKNFGTACGYYERAYQKASWFFEPDKKVWLTLLSEHVLWRFEEKPQKEIKNVFQYSVEAIAEEKDSEMLGRAQYYLGVYYERLRGDLVVANACFKKAAENGHPRAQYRTGCLAVTEYFTGLKKSGVADKKLYEEGTSWLRQAADKGYALAQGELIKLEAPKVQSSSSHQDILKRFGSPKGEAKKVENPAQQSEPQKSKLPVVCWQNIDLSKDCDVSAGSSSEIEKEHCANANAGFS